MFSITRRDELKDEYLMLREEILHLDSIVNNTINFFYVFIASYIAFALLQKDTIFILLSYIVIIPAYQIVLNKMQAICKIGSYLKIFHEGEDFNWETRHMQYKERYESSHFRIISWHFPFMLVSIAISVLFFGKMNWENIFSIWEIFKIIICINCILFILNNVYRYKNISPKDYIEKWEEIRDLK